MFVCNTIAKTTTAITTNMLTNNINVDIMKIIIQANILSHSCTRINKSEYFKMQVEEWLRILQNSGVNLTYENCNKKMCYH